ncbi:MAG TPA: hypothetical protein VG406_26075 [Isosphaeraceae bacterium]|jgi:hypothetical protein|nr:hypothetical protein [Isosphaeraceae bacterium]
MDGPPELDDLPDDLRARLKAELAPGERLLWAGRPSPKPVQVTKGYVIAALVALGLAALCVALLALPMPPPDRFEQPDKGSRIVLALGIGFLALMIALLTVAVWNSKVAGARREARRLYALTDRRAVVWKPIPGSEAVTVTSYHPRQIEGLHRVENPDGTGDVLFSGSGAWGTGFHGIADVRRVEDLVRMNLGHGVGKRKDEWEEE